MLVTACPPEAWFSSRWDSGNPTRCFRKLYWLGKPNFFKFQTKLGNMGIFSDDISVSDPAPSEKYLVVGGSDPSFEEFGLLYESYNSFLPDMWPDHKNRILSFDSYKPFLVWLATIQDLREKIMDDRTRWRVADVFPYRVELPKVAPDRPQILNYSRVYPCGSYVRPVNRFQCLATDIVGIAKSKPLEGGNPGVSENCPKGKLLPTDGEIMIVGLILLISGTSMSFYAFDHFYGRWFGTPLCLPGGVSIAGGTALFLNSIANLADVLLN